MSQLSQAIKAKYPQYAGVDDAVLEQKVLAKYPQYQRMAGPAPKTMSGFLGNVGKSAVNAVGGIGSALVNTLNPNMEQNTIANLGRLAYDTADLAGNAIKGYQTDENNRALQLGKFYGDRYGSMEKIGNTLYNDPVGVAMDASAVLGGTGAAARGLGMAKVGNTLGRVSRFIDPMTMPGRAVSKIPMKNFMQRAGKTVEEAGRSYATSGLGNPKTLKQIEGISGKRVGDLIDQYNLYDRSPEQVQKAIQAIDEQRRGIVNASGQKLSTSNIIKNFDDEISRISPEEAAMSDNARIMREELMRRKAEFIDSIQQSTPYTAEVRTRNPSSTSLMPMPDIVEQRQMYAPSSPLQLSADTVLNKKQFVGKDIASSKWNLDAAQTAKSDAARKTYNVFKDSFNSIDPRLKQLGRDESGLHSLQDVYENAAAREAARNGLSIQDMLFGGMGWMRDPLTAVASVAGSKIARSPTGIKYTSKAIQGMGKAMQNGQLPKLPSSVSNTASIGYNVGRAGRMVNDSSSQTNQIKQSPQPQLSSQSKWTSYPSSIPQTNAVATPKQPKVIIPKKSNMSFSNVKKVNRGSFY